MKKAVHPKKRAIQMYAERPETPAKVVKDRYSPPPCPSVLTSSKLSQLVCDRKIPEDFLPRFKQEQQPQQPFLSSDELLPPLLPHEEFRAHFTATNPGLERPIPVLALPDGTKLLRGETSSISQHSHRLHPYLTPTTLSHFHLSQHQPQPPPAGKSTTSLIMPPTESDFCFDRFGRRTSNTIADKRMKASYKDPMTFRLLGKQPAGKLSIHTTVKQSNRSPIAISLSSRPT